MKKSKKTLLSCLAIGISLSACVDNTKVKVPPKNQVSCAADIKSGKHLGIKPLPDNTPAAYKKAYCKYTDIVAPNGKAIKFYAQDQISNEQMVRARRILEFYLTPVKDSEQGSAKTAIANAMASSGANLVLMNGSDDGKNPVTVQGQPLYDTELVTEGATAYINNDYENHRDAAFEEILHMMHDYGIGTKSQAGANKDYSKQIDAATANAMIKKIWPTAGVDARTTSWIEELRGEGSLSQEYLASVIDSYYGYWGAWTEGNGGMRGIYMAKTRDEVKARDPMGYAVVEKYFSPRVTYLARIDSGFMGTFSMMFDANKPYTHKSQYLVNAELTGDKNSNLLGNQYDNQLMGNAGSNILDGQAGTDTVIFKGNFKEYIVDAQSGIVTDNKSNRDGVTTLKSIEVVAFKDKTFLLSGGILAEKNI